MIKSTNLVILGALQGNVATCWTCCQVRHVAKDTETFSREEAPHASALLSLLMQVDPFNIVAEGWQNPTLFVTWQRQRAMPLLPFSSQIWLRFLPGEIVAELLPLGIIVAPGGISAVSNWMIMTLFPCILRNCCPLLCPRCSRQPRKPLTQCWRLWRGVQLAMLQGNALPPSHCFRDLVLQLNEGEIWLNNVENVEKCRVFTVWHHPSQLEPADVYCILCARWRLIANQMQRCWCIRYLRHFVC